MLASSASRCTRCSAQTMHTTTNTDASMSSKHGRTESGQSHGHHPASLAEAIVHSINPFAAVAASREGLALKEDGTQAKSGSASASTSTNKDKDKDDGTDGDSDASNASSKGSTRRRSRGSALRSLSPFRFHSSKRSSSRTRLRISGNIDNADDDAATHPAEEKAHGSSSGGKRDWDWGWRRRSRRGSNETVTSANSSKRASRGNAVPADAEQDADHDDHSLDEVETGNESRMGSWTRICPRNNAFSSSATADDSEDTEEEAEAGAPRPPPKEAKKGNCILHSTHGAEQAEGDRPEAPADEEEEEDDESEIDVELLDNTLFNAGCLDLHNDWRDAHEYGEHQRWEGYDEDGIARPELLRSGHYGDEQESIVPYADPNHIGDTAIPDDADHLLNAPNLILSPSHLRHDPCGGSALVTPTGEDGGEILTADTKAASAGPDNAFDGAARQTSVSSLSSANSTSSAAAAAAAAAAASVAPLGITRDATLTSLMGSQLGTGDRALRASRPVFERNRCTITLLHGQYEEKLAASKRPKRYVVASDGSAEALYAIEWTIGTVMRDGDETMIVSVMETDTKLDAIDHVFEDKQTRMQHQKIRQEMALVLARQATNLLQRTRLGVKVVCQALHATNSRRMLIDLTDYFSPTLVIVGSRGVGSLKGILLGSTSHYLLQKASVPVMVARRRLRLPALPRGKADVVQSVRRRHLRLDEASIDKETPPVPEDEGAAAGGEGGKAEGGEAASTDGAAPQAEGGDDAAAVRSSVDTDSTAAHASASTASSLTAAEEEETEERSSRKAQTGGDDEERGRSRSRDGSAGAH